MNNKKPKAHFLGQGWAFPPGFSPIHKDVKLVSGVEDINQSLHILLSTQLGERVMLEDYGCNMEHGIFEPTSLSTQTYLRQLIENAVALYEARIRLNRIDFQIQDVNQDLILIELHYTVVNINTRFNFVYPYYLNEGTEVAALETFNRNL